MSARDISTHVLICQMKLERICDLVVCYFTIFTAVSRQP